MLNKISCISIMLGATDPIRHLSWWSMSEGFWYSSHGTILCFFLLILFGCFLGEIYTESILCYYIIPVIVISASMWLLFRRLKIVWATNRMDSPKSNVTFLHENQPLKSRINSQFFIKLPKKNYQNFQKIILKQAIANPSQSILIFSKYW